MSQQRDPYSNIPRPTNRSKQIDTHEILKQEIYKQGYEYDTGFRFGFNGPQVIGGNPGNPGSPVVNNPGPTIAGVGFEDTELYFDSTQRDTSSDYTIGEIRWNIAPLNNSQDIKSCIQLHLGTFFFPKIYASTGRPELFYLRRVFMEFQGAPSTQAVLGPNNNRFHFEFEVQNLNSQAVKLVPIKKSFFFQRPLTSLTEFQVRFMIPQMTSAATSFKKIVIPRDTVSVISLITGGAGYNPIRFRITGSDTTAALGPIGSTGTPGIAVFFSAYGSNNSSINTAVNSAEGVYVTNIVNTTDFEVAGINSSTLTATYAATMFIPKNRIAFPVRFTSVRDQLTNYIEVSHN